MKKNYNKNMTDNLGIKLYKYPNCNSFIEKVEGCSHMDCLMCYHTWCWTCGYPKGHFFHIITNEYICKMINNMSF